jgi:hypothetical protein
MLEVPLYDAVMIAPKFRVYPKRMSILRAATKNREKQIKALVRSWVDRGYNRGRFED